MNDDAIHSAALTVAPFSAGHRRNFVEKGAAQAVQGTQHYSPATARANLAKAQVFGYVEETTRRSGGHMKANDVNTWGRQIRAKTIWLLR